MGKLIFRSAACAAGLFALLVVGTTSGVTAQEQRTPVPLFTLIAPTLAPTTAPTTLPPLTVSIIADIKKRDPQVLRIGILYNVERFSSLNTSGEVRGFEADIGRAIAEDWGIKPEFVQVTRHNGVKFLLSGQIDLLMGQVVVTREDQNLLDYSDPLFINAQVALIKSDSGIADIHELAGKTVGVVAQTRAEQAFRGWMGANGLQATVNSYALMDDALRALVNNEVVAVAGDRWELDALVNGKIMGVSLLPSAFRLDPYAIAMRRHDSSLRTLVNRTLQRMVASNRFGPIYDLWFPKNLLPVENRVVPRVWKDLDEDKRLLADFETDIVLPQNPVVQKIKAKQPIRVAGLGALADSSGNIPKLDIFNQTLMNELARRWGVTVEMLPNTYGKGEDSVASGEADLAVGVEPHWSAIDRVDFVGIYAQHGYRIMVPFGSTAVRTFGDLFSTRRQIGYFIDDPEAIEVAKKLAETVRIAEIIPIPLRTAEDAIQRLVTDHTANIVFGDSLYLIPMADAYPKFFQLTEGEYGEKKPIAFAVARNDADFRVLVDVTLQDMYRDGTYASIYSSTFGIGDPLTMIVWPGPTEIFGVKTSK